MIENTLIIEKLNNIEKKMSEINIKNDNWMSLKDVQKYTGLSASTLRRQIYLGRIKCSQKTGKILFRRQAVDNWLDN